METCQRVSSKEPGLSEVLCLHERAEASDGDSDFRETRMEEGVDLALLPHLFYRLHTESIGVDVGGRKGEREREEEGGVEGERAGKLG